MHFYEQSYNEDQYCRYRNLKEPIKSRYKNARMAVIEYFTDFFGTDSTENAVEALCIFLGMADAPPHVGDVVCTTATQKSRKRKIRKKIVFVCVLQLSPPLS